MTVFSFLAISCWSRKAELDLLSLCGCLQHYSFVLFTGGESEHKCTQVHACGMHSYPLKLNWCLRFQMFYSDFIEDFIALLVSHLFHPMNMKDYFLQCTKYRRFWRLYRCNLGHATSSVIYQTNRKGNTINF